MPEGDNFPVDILLEEEAELKHMTANVAKSFAYSIRQLAKLPVLGENLIYEIISNPPEIGDTSVVSSVTSHSSRTHLLSCVFAEN